MGTTSMTCLLFIAIHLIQLVTAQEVVKRVPQGFVGMRGKKYLGSGESEQFYKRKPQFFVGVKGKKSDIGYEYLKRAPMGFVGMRGKKEYMPDGYDSYDLLPKRDGSLFGQIDYSAGDDVKDTNFSLLKSFLEEYLQKLKNEEESSDLEENLREVNTEPNEHITNEISKRAANIHQFFGVRGKKTYQNKRPFDLSFRGKFIGVRGKKDVTSNEAQEVRFLLDQNPWNKRKQMGFFGMRGKKWNDDQMDTDTESPN